MAQLILINGTPGIGKSTLARRFIEDHPLALTLDIDVFRGLLGKWMDHPSEAGVAARKMALAAAKVHLESGRDVVVPQYLGRLEFIEQLEILAAETQSHFFELMLWTDRDDATQRFESRSSSSTIREHRDAALLIQQFGPMEFDAMYQRLLQVIASRPNTKTVPTVDGEIEQTYIWLMTHIHQ